MALEPHCLCAVADGWAFAGGAIIVPCAAHTCHRPSRFSSIIKLFIENMGFPSVLAGKPVALLGVAAGQIGAIKALEHLRSVCSHIGAIVLPGTVSVAGVQSLFDEQGRCLDEPTERRIRDLATQMLDYIRANICPRVALEEMARKGSTDWMKRFV